LKILTASILKFKRLLTFKKFHNLIKVFISNFMDLSIIIATYNERENIERIIRVIKTIFKVKKIQGEVIIIDDNSPDGTGVIADELAKKNKFVRVIHRERKLGLGTAYKLGFKNSKAPLIMEMDADLSHDPRYIPDFLEALSTHDVAVGSRYVDGGGMVDRSIYQTVVSLAANFIANLLLKVKTHDASGGYRAYRKSALSRINLDDITSNGYSFQVDILTRLIRKGCTVKEIPYVFVDRKYGKTKLSKSEIIQFFFTILRLIIKK